MHTFNTVAYKLTLEQPSSERFLFWKLGSNIAEGSSFKTSKKMAEVAMSSVSDIVFSWHALKHFSSQNVACIGNQFKYIEIILCQKTLTLTKTV